MTNLGKRNLREPHADISAKLVPAYNPHTLSLQIALNPSFGSMHHEPFTDFRSS